MIVGVNRWETDKAIDSKTFIEKLFSVMTIPLSDGSDEGNDIPMLFKDPTDDSDVLIESFFVVPASKRISYYNCIYSKDKIKDPFRNIFSPPPQFI